MSARTARLLAVPFAVLAFALRLAEALWLRPLAWRTGASGLGIDLAILAASLIVPLGGYLLLTRRARKRQASWRLDPDARRLFAGPTPYGMAASVWGGWGAAGVVPVERVPNEDRARIADSVLPGPVAIPLALLLLLLVVVVPLLTRPTMALDREGITVRGWIRCTRLLWADLAQAQVVVPAEEKQRKVIIRLPQTAVGSGQTRVRIPADRLHIDPGFLAFSIRHFLTAPEQRSSIGSAAGLDVLTAAYRGAGSAAAGE